MDNDVDSDFEEDSVSGTNDTEWWWLRPVEISFIEGRHEANPVVDFP